MKRTFATILILVIFAVMLSLGVSFVNLSHGVLESYLFFCIGFLTSEVVDYFLSKPISKPISR